LAEVYSELLGGRQTTLGLVENGSSEDEVKASDEFSGNAQKRPTELQSRLTKSEQEAHAAFIAELGKDSVWLKYHKAVSSEA